MLNLEELKCQKVAVEAAIDLIEAQRLAGIAMERVNYFRKLVTDNCQHVETSPKRSYFSGSYYDKSSVTLWDECDLCGKRLNERDDPNHYGSYA